MPTLIVIDGSGTSRTINTLPNLGQANSANSQAVVIASDQSVLPVSGVISFSNTGIGINNATIVSGALNVNPIFPVTIQNTSGTPIYVLDAFQPVVVAAWSGSTAANTSLVTSTAGYDTILITAVTSGTVTSGTIVFEGFDGANWLSIRAGLISGYSSNSSYNLNQGAQAWQAGVAGFPQFRIRLLSGIVGGGTGYITTIASSAPDISSTTVGLDPIQPLPSGYNYLGQVAFTNTGIPISGFNILSGNLGVYVLNGNSGINSVTFTNTGVGINAALPSGSNFLGSVSVLGNQIVMTDYSSGIVTTGTSQVAISGSIYRRGYHIQNLSTNYLWFNETGPASSGAGSKALSYLGLYECPEYAVPTGNISVYGIVSGQLFTAKAW